MPTFDEKRSITHSRSEKRENRKPSFQFNYCNQLLKVTSAVVKVSAYPSIWRKTLVPYFSASLNDQDIAISLAATWYKSK